MAEIKLTKNALREEQQRLSQLLKYLPTLQLKKALLQTEVNEARHEIQVLDKGVKELLEKAQNYQKLLSENAHIDTSQVAVIDEIKKHYDNIAGVEVPIFEDVTFKKLDYYLVDTPVWLDDVIVRLEEIIKAKVKVEVAHEFLKALEKELRQVSIRVNLFEKVLIPRATKNINKIKVFLGDQQLGAVGQLKVVKAKKERRKELAKSLEEANAL